MHVTFKMTKEKATQTLDFANALSLLTASRISGIWSTRSFWEGLISYELQMKLKIQIWTKETAIWKSDVHISWKLPESFRQVTPQRFARCFWISLYKMKALQSYQDWPDYDFKAFSGVMKPDPIAFLGEHRYHGLHIGKVKLPGYDSLIYFLEAIISSPMQENLYFLAFDQTIVLTPLNW